jgi:hypothetical protein
MRLSLIPISCLLLAACTTAAAPEVRIARSEVEREVFNRVVGGAPLPSRPWHAGPDWLAESSGRVGKLYDLCTGAIEPQPALAMGDWSNERSDPSTLSPEERLRLIEWLSQRYLAHLVCGYEMDSGAGEQARQLVSGCEASIVPARTRAFINYVKRHPTMRARDDLVVVIALALKLEGCA